MTAVLDAVAQRLAHSGSPRAADGVEVSSMLSQPIRVGVVGRVSAGKSTLVNALLGTAIAPTGAGETTTVPCWFRHGRYTTASVRGGSGRSAPVRLEGDHLPDLLPAGFDVASDTELRLEVSLSSPVLQHFNVVDTPGVASTRPESSARTAALLTDVTGRCAERVEALVLVLTGTLRAEDADAVRALIEAVPAVGGAPVVAALTRVDTLDQDLDRALVAARELAAAIHAEHADTLDAVVPVVGLLAETAASGALTETDVRDIRELDRDLLVEDRELALVDVRILDEIESHLPAGRRRELVALLGLAGLGWVMTFLRERPRASAGDVCDALARLAGTDELVRVLRSALLARTDQIKASMALARLEDAAADPTTPDDVVDDVARAALSSTLLPVALTRGVQLLGASRTPLPPDLADELARTRRLGVAGLEGLPPAQAAARWRRWQLLADGPGRAGAAVLLRGHQHRAGAVTSS